MSDLNLIMGKKLYTVRGQLGLSAIEFGRTVGWTEIDVLRREGGACALPMTEIMRICCKHDLNLTHFALLPEDGLPVTLQRHVA